MLTIRLQRAGKKNHSNFKVVLAEKESSVSKKVTEILGSYNPHTKDLSIKDPERLNYWIALRTSISPTAHNLLVEKGFLKAAKVKAFNTPKKAPEKPEEKVAEKPEEKVQEPATAPATAETPPAEAVTEAPVEAVAETPAATEETPSETPIAPQA